MLSFPKPPTKTSDIEVPLKVRGKVDVLINEVTPNASGVVPLTMAKYSPELDTRINVSVAKFPVPATSVREP